MSKRSVFNPVHSVMRRFSDASSVKSRRGSRGHNTWVEESKTLAVDEYKVSVGRKDLSMGPYSL